MPCIMSYSAEESSPVEYFDSCCICDEEFSSDGELSNHLLDHANDEEFKASLAQFEKKSSPAPNARNQTTLKRNFTQRSTSPEVWEIISDDDDDESNKNKTPKLNNSFRLVSASGNNAPGNNTPGNNTAGNNTVGNNTAGNNTQPKPSQPNTPIENGPPYNCFTCKMVFKDVKVYKEHLLIHDKPRPYSCQICNKKFAYKGTLRQHLHKHIGEKSHECKICHKKFSMKKMLLQHEETHEAEQRQTRMQTRRSAQ